MCRPTICSPRSYPLTPPAVRPATILRWKIRTRTTSGTVTITEAAMMLPQGISNCGAAREQRDRHRHGALVVFGGEGQREQELVPRADEGEQPVVTSAGHISGRKTR